LNLQHSIGAFIVWSCFAGELAERHGLRGYDAVHLASAISIEDADLVTATWDEALAAAVTASGYAVVPACAQPAVITVRTSIKHGGSGTTCEP
jgi:hypothetical protein